MSAAARSELAPDPPGTRDSDTASAAQAAGVTTVGRFAGIPSLSLTLIRTLPEYCYPMTPTTSLPGPQSPSLGRAGDSKKI